MVADYHPHHESTCASAAPAGPIQGPNDAPVRGRRLDAPRDPHNGLGVPHRPPSAAGPQHAVAPARPVDRLVDASRRAAGTDQLASLFLPERDSWPSTGLDVRGQQYEHGEHHDHDRHLDRRNRRPQGAPIACPRLILAALNLLLTDPKITDDDAKAQDACPCRPCSESGNRHQGVGGLSSDSQPRHSHPRHFDTTCSLLTQLAERRATTLENTNSALGSSHRARWNKHLSAREEAQPLRELPGQLVSLERVGVA